MNDRDKRKEKKRKINRNHSFDLERLERLLSQKIFS